MVPFEGDLWTIEAKESRVLDYLGRKSLYLKSGQAIVRGSNVLNGVIEFDIAFSNERGFSGEIWRVQNSTNYEEFYLRPHQSGNPDANQYTPVFDDEPGWQMYYGEEYSVPFKYVFNDWMHIKIGFSGSAAEVYLIDMESPALYIPELKRPAKSGAVGLESSNFAPAYFSNFSYQSSDNVILKGTSKPRKIASPNHLKSILVSEPFSEKNLAQKTQLMDSERGNLKWNQLDAELSGIFNLARVAKWAEEKNTVFAKFQIESDRAQVKGLKFGFSDRIRVYLNGRLIFAGMDEYQSRDYRFLGTVGLYDILYLPFEQGNNEILFAISEDWRMGNNCGI
jgi:hypothetical protein